MDDVAVALEHVHLLDGLDGLNIDLLEGGLELLVIASGAGRRSLDLSAGSTLATISFRKKSPLSEIKSLSFCLHLHVAHRLSLGSRGEVFCVGDNRGRARERMEG